MKKSTREYGFLFVPRFHRFPMDMLRYDCAWPVRGEDVSRIEATLDGACEYDLVVHLATDKQGGWTGERWRSFGVTLFTDQDMANSCVRNREKVT